jgi:signal transduction histidine kinase/ActR/RegA family two-component response regulator
MTNWKEFTNCPVSGLPVIQKPEWQYVDSKGDYQARYDILGDRILWVRTSGTVTRDILENVLKLYPVVLNEGPGGRGYVHIEDFSNLKGVSYDARKFYIGYMKKRENILGLIFFGASAMLKLSIKLARRLNIVKFNVYIVNDYKQAVELALELLQPTKSKPVSMAGHNKKASRVELKDLEIVTKDDWSLQLGSFHARFEIIAGNIFHADTGGFLENEHVEHIFNLQENIIQSMPLPEGSYYFVGGVRDVEGSRKARKLYINYILKWYKNHPFKMYIFYGANRLLRAAINIARFLAPFPVRMEKDLDSALRYALEDRREDKGEDKEEDEAGKPVAPDLIGKYVSELLQYIGSINWDRDGPGEAREIDANHPFKQVFDAISLIKMDLDDLFRERERTEAERRDLEKKLHNSEKMEAIGTLAGGVAHDLNNILSGIVGYPDLMLMKLPQDSELRKPLLTIQGTGKKAAAIVLDLLTLARRGVAVSEVINLNQVISQYLKSPEYNRLISYHPGVEIDTRLESRLLNISGSPVHLSKTVMNLVSNAAEAMPRGGKLSISTENRYIDRPVKGYDKVEPGDYVIVEFRDTGIGISPGDIDKIFEPFYTKKKMGRSGTGLGMAVVWSTVKDHSGYIDLKSIEEKGTTFTIYFPVCREEIPDDKSPLDLRAYKGRGESILVVDDVEEQREIAAVMLKELGYSVTSVSSGEAAVEYIKDNPTDLILLDMIMDPGIDGLETYSRILELFPGQKAVLASGFSKTDHIKEAQRLGAGSYLKKPYTLEALGLSIKKELTAGPAKK